MRKSAKNIYDETYKAFMDLENGLVDKVILTPF